MDRFSTPARSLAGGNSQEPATAIVGFCFRSSLLSCRLVHSRRLSATSLERCSLPVLPASFDPLPGIVSGTDTEARRVEPDSMADSTKPLQQVRLDPFPLDLCRLLPAFHCRTAGFRPGAAVHGVRSQGDRESVPDCLATGGDGGGPAPAGCRMLRARRSSPTSESCR